MNEQQAQQQALLQVKQVRETSDLREAARLLDEGWQVIGTAKSKNGLKLSLGYFGPVEPTWNEKSERSAYEQNAREQTIKILLRQMDTADKSFADYHKSNRETGRFTMDDIRTYCRIVNDFAHTIAELLR